MKELQFLIAASVGYCCACAEAIEVCLAWSSPGFEGLHLEVACTLKGGVFTAALALSQVQKVFKFLTFMDIKICTFCQWKV